MMTKEPVLPEASGRRAADPRAGGARDWVVRELHDEVAQPLWYLTMELAALRRELPSGAGELHRRVTELESVAQEGYERLRAVMSEAKGAASAGVSLRQMVEERVAAYQRLTGAPVHATLPLTDARIHPQRARHASAVLQEALWNTWKHAGGQGVRVVLEVASGAASITVADGGPGCDARRSPKGHFGLTCMKARAAALEGALSIRSARGHGTRVRLAFPIVTPRPPSRAGEPALDSLQEVKNSRG